MTIKTTRIDDLTGRVIDGLFYAEIEIRIREVGPTAFNEGVVQRFHLHTENATILALSKKILPEEVITSTCLDFLRKLIRDELENAQT